MTSKNLLISERVQRNVNYKAHSGQLSTVTYVEFKEQVNQNVKDN
jgi:hypothetical protein